MPNVVKQNIVESQIQQRILKKKEIIKQITTGGGILQKQLETYHMLTSDVENP